MDFQLKTHRPHTLSPPLFSRAGTSLFAKGINGVLQSF